MGVPSTADYGPGLYPPVFFQQNAMTGGWQEVMPRESAGGDLSFEASGNVYFSYFTCRQSATISKLSMDTAGTAVSLAPSKARYGLYTVDGSGNLTLVASTPNDTTLFASTYTVYTKSLSVNYAVTQGVRYAIGLCIVGTSLASFAGSFGDAQRTFLAPVICSLVGGQTDLPSSVSAGSLQSTPRFMFMAMQ